MFACKYREPAKCCDNATKGGPIVGRPFAHLRAKNRVLSGKKPQNAPDFVDITILPKMACNEMLGFMPAAIRRVMIVLCYEWKARHGIPKFYLYE